MLSTLGVPVVLCVSLGGEAGDVLEHLLPIEGVDVRVIRTGTRNGGYVHDRRDDDRSASRRRRAARWTATSRTRSMSSRWPKGCATAPRSWPGPTPTR